MRSRYSAFVVADAAYLLATWHPTTRPADVGLDPAQRWTGLEVLATTGGGFLDAEGTVEFRASSVGPGGPAVLHEDSLFTRDAGRWAYLGPVRRAAR
jgi:SEC-C motif-containing protein